MRNPTLAFVLSCAAFSQGTMGHLDTGESSDSATMSRKEGRGIRTFAKLQTPALPTPTITSTAVHYMPQPSVLPGKQNADSVQEPNSPEPNHGGEGEDAERQVVFMREL
ncbi:hypothetical protein EVG20_g7695 [Dentipellis fragilis]|uniref:Uncharacterized protein n=1 Tax=Dentipellis fragilis TaxID=205917 RepID=A0A4Y9YD80_9AGAM|nr:hypothetical protein EVG20_g7695 [Dentipellis fragilis]